MARRHHRKSYLKRRQFGPSFAENPLASDSPPASSTSSSNTASDADDPVVPPAGSSKAGNNDQGISNDNNPNNPGNLPIVGPNNPLPSTPTSNSLSAPTSSSPIPSVDPFPPNGANQPSAHSPLSSSNALSSSSTPSSSSTTFSLSSTAGSPSSFSSLVSSSMPSPTRVAAQVPPALSSSSSLAFNTVDSASPLAEPQTTISGLIPTPTGNFTSSAPSSTSISTPAIVGIAAGGLCGLAILGAAVLWIGKRVSRYMETKELEPPPMHEPIANDDPILILRRPSGPNTTPRPPTMIERRQANLAGRGNGFYNNNSFNPQTAFSPYAAADSHFGNPSPFVPGHYPAAPVNHSPTVQPYFSPIAVAISPFDDTAAAVPSTPGTPIYFSRQNSVQSGFASVPSNGDLEAQLPNPYDNPAARPNDGYATLNRGPGPATPQRQYADLARLHDFSPSVDRTISPVPSTNSYATVPFVSHDTSAPSSPKSPSSPMSPSLVTVPTELHDGRATPVQFGFAGPVPVASASEVQPGNVSTSQLSRPETIYDEEDAYAAI